MRAHNLFHPTAFRAACALAMGVGLALPAWAQVNLQFSASPVPQPWYVGDTHPVTFTVTNAGATASAAGARALFSIPAETVMTSALPAACNAAAVIPAGVQAMDCQLPALAAGGTATFAVNIKSMAAYPPPGNGTYLVFSATPTYDPTGGTTHAAQPQQLFSNPNPFFIISRPVTSTAPTAVPTLNLLGLGLLGAAVGWMGAGRRKKTAA